jgi:hypothetical protein
MSANTYGCHEYSWAWDALGERVLAWTTGDLLAAGVGQYYAHQVFGNEDIFMIRMNVSSGSICTDPVVSGPYDTLEAAILALRVLS